MTLPLSCSQKQGSFRADAMTQLLSTVYLACAMFIAVYSASQLILLALYLIHFRLRHDPATPHTQDWPYVAVQLPIYNERQVVARLIETMAALDYPRDRLLIQVLDDSTDDTPSIVATRVAKLRRKGINIQHIRRENRVGYKAGALAHGLTLLPPEYTLTAIFDADFVPRRDFLKRTVPHFSTNPKLGIVQGRWGHLNPTENLLTRAQSMAIDLHFAVEQVARNRSGLLLTFNGTGGVWRIACITEAGGWSADTLCEDLDLSYRAQIKGWHYLYLPDVVVPGEIPPTIAAYKTQQTRWAKGCNQALAKLIVPVWRGRLSLPRRIMATQHLVQYLPHIITLIMLLLTPPMIASGMMRRLPLTALGLAGLGLPLLQVTAQAALYRDWPRRLVYWPFLMLLGTGITVNNARAALDAFRSVITGKPGEFIRTPKFAGNIGAYASRGDLTTWIELALGIYAIYGIFLARKLAPGMIPYLVLYAVSLCGFALLSLRDRRLSERASRAVPAKAGVR